MKGNPIYRIVGLGILVSVVLAHISGQINMLTPNWIWIPTFMGFMMLQASFTGFCPMSKFFGQDPETGACCGADTSGTCCTPKEDKKEEASSCCSGSDNQAASSSCCSGGESEEKSETSCCGGDNQEAGDTLVVKVLGTGCANCVSTAKLIEQQAEKLGIPVKVVKVEEIADIAGYGVMSTPGIVIHEKVVHAGGVPSAKQIEAWLKEG